MDCFTAQRIYVIEVLNVKHNGSYSYVFEKKLNIYLFARTNIQLTKLFG